MVFRAYFIDERGHVRAAVDVDAASAAAALEAAQRLRGQHLIEVWEIGRHDHLIQSFEPLCPSSAPPNAEIPPLGVSKPCLRRSTVEATP